MARFLTQAVLLVATAAFVCAQSPPFDCLAGVASVPAFSVTTTSAAVGDFTLTCTGGTAGVAQPVTLQFLFNANIINSGSWTLTDGPNSYAGALGTVSNPGQPSAINFPNVPFTEPGTSSITWTVQNILVNPSQSASGFQYIEEVAANGNASLSIGNPQEVVATNQTSSIGVVTLAASGTLSDGASLGGTITVDQSAGQVTASSLTVSAPDSVNASTILFDHATFQGNTSVWYLGVQGAAPYPDLSLLFPVSSLVGYAGGPLCSASMPCGGDSSYLTTGLGQGPILQSGGFSLVSSTGLTSQTITFGSLPNVALGTPPFSISATASSGLAVSFASTTPTVCTVSGNTVTILAAGACSITATQAGNATYAAATPVTQSFRITAAAGTTTYVYSGPNFNTFMVVNGWTGGTPTRITASLTFSAPLPPNFKYSIPPAPVAWTISDGIHSFSSPGPSCSFCGTNIAIGTDANGNFLYWEFQVIAVTPDNHTEFLQAAYFPAGIVGSTVQPFDSSVEVYCGGTLCESGPTDGVAENQSVPGTWQVQSGGSSTSCNIALSPPSQLIGAAAGNGTIGVLTDPACSWDAASASSFLAITSGSTGTGSGAVTFSATANTSASARTGAITVSGQAAIINQSGTAPILLLSPSSTAIQWTQGSPSPAPVPLSIYTQAASLAFTTSVSSGDSWLSVSPSSGNAPATILVNINPGSLAPGTYPATLSVTASAANPSTQTFTASLTVLPASAPTLSVSTKNLSYSLPQGSQAQQQTIPVSNAGSGTLTFQAASSTSSGGTWLSVSPGSGTATLSAPGSVTVTINPGSLTAGTYTGAITITADTTAVIPVTLVITAAHPVIALTQDALTFTAVANGGAVPTQTFGIANAGAGVMSWSVSSSVTDTGNWLSANPASGSTDAASQTVPLVTVSVNPANLTAGQYSGQIQVGSPAANNSPEFVSVIVNVLPAGSNPGAVVLPAGLIFTQAVGGPTPGSQTITVSNLTGAKLTFATQVETSDGGSWLSATPVTGTASPAAATTLMVSVSGTGLAAGTRQGIVTLFFEDGSVQTVNVIYLLAAGGVTSQRTGLAHPVSEATSASCMPTELLPLLTSLGQQFTVPAAWPNTLEAQVVDDCGNPQVSGTVVTSFSNGDPPVPLISLKNGSWTGTWQITNNATSNIAVTVNANDPSLGISGSTSVSGSLQNSVNAPVIAAGGVFNAASYAPSAPLAPGAMIAIFGSNLANGTTPVNTFPLPEQLSGTLVTIGGEPAPLLYAGSGQINAIVPFGLAVNTNTQVIVRQGNAYTAPMGITLAAANPAIFTTSGSGTGQGVIIRPDGNIAQPGTPAQAGDELLIYAAGLGATNPLATDAEPATGSPLLYTAGTATLTIGGQNARVDFAGLAPGYAGLYQINAAVPQGVHGSTLPVVLSVGGQPGPPVTMAVQ